MSRMIVIDVDWGGWHALLSDSINPFVPANIGVGQHYIRSLMWHALINHVLGHDSWQPQIAADETRPGNHNC
jgi:hypothetical protein